ncbi:MAG: C_GCAxxG_C_C family protein [Candidatus Helarchaeota archaeon]|nr:C_GCAxxG_C_C family protein [Candidatus Helarchaeota archaeon]
MIKQKNDFPKKAAFYFKQGFNCAEGVLMTMQEAWNMEPITPKLATAFGGGIGRSGSVCGSVSGGILAINLKYGRSNIDEDKSKAYNFANEFIKKFRNEFASEICYELIQCDLMDPEDRKKLVELNILQEKCIKFVMKTVEILLEISESVE